jgi:hypothetical protein
MGIITALSITAFSIMAIGIMGIIKALSKMTFSILTLGIKGIILTVRIRDNFHQNTWHPVSFC